MRWRRWGHAVCVVVLVLAGLLLRLSDLEDPPLDFHATRQLHSAEIARGMYYADLESAPAWQRALAQEGWDLKSVNEPPILETLAVAGYRIVGDEALWIPRVLSIGFWALGSLAVYAAARRLVGPVGALAALAYVTFFGFGVVASRAFMPDPLMVALMAGSLWLAVGWATESVRGRQWAWAVTAGLVTGLAVLVKPLSGFMLAPFWVGLSLGTRGWRAVTSGQLYVAAALAALPPLLLYGVAQPGTTSGQFAGRFYPELWGSADFYAGWGAVVDGVFGTPWLLVAAVGVCLVPHRGGLASLWGWVVGYVVLGFTVSHHMSTHDYYSLPLAPVVAVGVGAVLAAVASLVRRRSATLRVGVALLLALGVAWSATASYRQLMGDDFRGEAARWRALGQIFDPSDKVTGLLPEYGHPFRYFGWRSFAAWPSVFDRDLMDDEAPGWFESEWTKRTRGSNYFLITEDERWQLSEQTDLRDHLSEHCALVNDAGTYLLYDLRSSSCRRPGN